VVADLAGGTDRLGRLRRIGIDEIAHRRGHLYLTVVVDRDSGRLVGAGQWPVIRQRFGLSLTPSSRQRRPAPVVSSVVTISAPSAEKAG
jgi:hypothetical protein